MTMTVEERVETAVEAARAAGHEMFDDPPSTMSAGYRWSCRKCWSVVMRYEGNVYGSLVTDLKPCRV